ncbi:MAG: ABC transporter ATP-binding protein [Clostridiales bacterium]|nr:ABC transporter ATP-binding protein [Clostridiales bacterium]
MIEVKSLTKKYDGFTAVDRLDLTINEAEVFGLIGTNGAGKSTLLKMVSGIIRPDEGSMLVDGEEIFENIAQKQKIFYISDEQHFFANAKPGEMAVFYSRVYESFDTEMFRKLMTAFELPAEKKINTYSKGMKKLLSVLLGISSKTKYLLCDETFDGLDPVMRQAVKSLLAGEMEDRGLTPVIASHNLRELEDICDHVGLLHKGGILLSKDLDDMKLNIHKIQCVLRPGMNEEDINDLDIIAKDRRGSLLTLTVRGIEEEINSIMQQLDPVFYELVPLTLEEIFICETEVKGYDIKKLLL